MNQNKAIDLLILVAQGKLPKLSISSHDMYIFKPLIEKNARKVRLSIYHNGAGEVVLA